MKDAEGMFVLLQDLREMLWGLIPLLIALPLCVPALLFMDTNPALLALMAGIAIYAAGICRACHGFIHHEVVEKKDGT